MTSLLGALSATEKGYFRWVMVAASFTLLLVLWGSYAGFGVFLPHLVQEFGWDRGSVGTALSIVMVVGAPVGLLIGRLIDRHSPHVVMLVEVVICGASLLLASTTQSLWQLYLYLGLCLGVGFAGSYIVPMTTAARWFVRNRGLGVGLALTGQSLGYLVGPLLTAQLIQSLGWRGAFASLGAIILAVGIGPAAVLRNPPAPATSEPEARPALRSQAQSAAPSRDAPAFTVQRTLRSSIFWMLCFVWVFEAFANTMLTIHLVPLMVDKGHSLTLAAGTLSLYGVGTVLGRFSGPLSDRFGHRITQAATMTLAAISLGALLIVHDLTLDYVCALMFGIGLMGADTAVMRGLPEIVGTTALGRVLSMLSFGFRVGASAGPAFAGFMFDLTHSYNLPFGLGTFGLLAAAGLFLAATRPRGLGALEGRKGEMGKRRRGANLQS